MTNTELKTETKPILTYSPATNLSILLNLITEAIIAVQQKNDNVNISDLNSDDIIENIALIISRLMMKKLTKVKKIAAEKDQLRLKSDRESKEKLLKLEDRTSELIAEVLEDGYVLEKINDWNKNGILQNKIDLLKQHAKED